MDRGTAAFWGLIFTLLAASGYFGLQAEQQRRTVQRGNSHLEDGAVVALAQVIDGDTVLVQTESGDTAAVRILGIKAFSAQPEKDPTSRFGKQAMESLRQLLQEQPIRVALHSTPADNRGRTLARLFVGEEDVAMKLLEQGQLLVYTVYPFPAMPLYLKEQEAARAAGSGLWGDPEVAERADLLLKEWRRRAQ